MNSGTEYPTGDRIFSEAIRRENRQERRLREREELREFRAEQKRRREQVRVAVQKSFEEKLRSSLGDKPSAGKRSTSSSRKKG